MSAARIHPTALVDPAAELGAGVEIGPYCVVGPGVILGDGCWLQHHVTLLGPSRVGADNRFFAYCSIGQQSQDLKYDGEPTHLEIGDGNCFREFVTVHRATGRGAWTRVGSGGNFLAYGHIAHDCRVGDGVIFSNNATLGGHVEAGDHAVIGGLTAVHQFCRIGRFAMIGGCAKIVQDVAPFMIADGNPAVLRGVNQVGLERNGVGAAAVRALKEAFRTLFRSAQPWAEAVAQAEADGAAVPEVRHLIEFLRGTTRGVIRAG